MQPRAHASRAPEAPVVAVVDMQGSWFCKETTPEFQNP